MLASELWYYAGDNHLTAGRGLEDGIISFSSRETRLQPEGYLRSRGKCISGLADTGRIMESDSEIIEVRGPDRRLIEDRRQVKDDNELRKKQRNIRRRTGIERRQWPHGLIFTTSDSLSLIKKWLGEKCRGNWLITTEAKSDSVAKTSYRLMFELEDDKDSFCMKYFPASKNKSP